jgi:biopolymer transport protein ExbB
METVSRVYHYLNQGGIVMIPLIICSCVMWALILERMIYFYFLKKNDIAFHRLLPLLKQGEIPQSFDGIRAFLIRELLSSRTGIPEVDRRTLEACAMVIRPRLKRFISVIAVLAAVSPLFGLLGTVTGMITTFDVITLFGTGNAKAMAGGISEALVTTQRGLMVSIPGLLMGVILHKKALQEESRLQEAVMILKRSLK